MPCFCFCKFDEYFSKSLYLRLVIFQFQHARIVGHQIVAHL